MQIPSDSLARFERLSFVSRLPARAGLGGEHRSRRRAPSTEFVEYRPYQPGDDFRRVDWNVYGRLGTLQVRVTEGRERLSGWLERQASACTERGLRYVRLRTDRALDSVLLDDLRRGNVLR